MIPHKILIGDLENMNNNKFFQYKYWVLSTKKDLITFYKAKVDETQAENKMLRFIIKTKKEGDWQI